MIPKKPAPVDPEWEPVSAKIMLEANHRDRDPIQLNWIAI
jgi:hypothetical protein